MEMQSVDKPVFSLESLKSVIDFQLMQLENDLVNEPDMDIRNYYRGMIGQACYVYEVIRNNGCLPTAAKAANKSIKEINERLMPPECDSSE